VPLTRAEYILKENQIELPQDNSSLDQEFLLDMMERNEEVEEASSKTDIDDLLASSKSDIDSLIEKLEGALEKNDFESAKSFVVRIKYMLSIKNSILEKAACLGFAEVK
jgi:molecular chaperone HscB